MTVEEVKAAILSVFPWWVESIVEDVEGGETYSHDDMREEAEDFARAVFEHIFGEDA